ncbi:MULTISPECIES: 7TM diverse intracellular signaling domain-containing protein [Ramlibacter]|uniref:Diguanylate cyclase n=1 Tax=Ramlibacter aquaticus TaxID=2780094 RepID=A0ABR9SDC3_9BURK|nr:MULTISPECIES: 7TM diverse intracellular signaling domain-containing protein [Ramlibacter]MBE7940295.1 diguanylate cyclase [Ramlibacter aquaticus]
MLAILWVLLMLPAFARAQAPAASAAAAAPAPLLVLSATQPLVPLESRSRYWLDESGMRTPEEVDRERDRLPWQVRGPGMQHDIDAKALWIEFEAQRADASRWFLEIKSSGLDRAQFFWRQRDGRWVSEEAGDTRPVSAWPIPGRFPTFELAGETGVPVHYYVRIELARVNFASPLALYDERELLGEREAEQFLLGGYFSLALLITLVSLALAVADRDRNFAAYATYVLAMGLAQAAYLGVGTQHLWPNMLKWNEMAPFVLPGVAAAAGLWFAKVVTEPARYSRALDLAVWSLIAGVLAAVGLDAWINTRASFELVMVLSLVAIVVVFVLIALVWRQGEDPLIRLVALGFLPVLLTALLPLARGLNLIPTSAWTRYGLTAGAALEMPILFYALMRRGAARREAQTRASALPGSDTLTGLATRATLLQRLQAAQNRAVSLRQRIALLGVRIANLDAIVAEHGRDTGERALVVAASLLRAAGQDIDLAARLGEHDLALMIDGPVTAEIATSRAQQLVASGLRPSASLPPDVTLRFRVTVALLPEGERDAASALAWVQEALDAPRTDARKMIRALNA